MSQPEKVDPDELRTARASAERHLLRLLEVQAEAHVVGAECDLQRARAERFEIDALIAKQALERISHLGDPGCAVDFGILAGEATIAAREALDVLRGESASGEHLQAAVFRVLVRWWEYSPKPEWSASVFVGGVEILERGPTPEAAIARLVAGFDARARERLASRKWRGS